MHDEVQVIAGECTAALDGPQERTQRGEMVVLVKPDNTVLVHDADGYQPAAWLTRPDAVQFVDGVLTARDGDQRLRVEVHAERGTARFPASPAGPPVGDCPDCGGVLVRTRGSVDCLDCEASHGVPGDGAVVDGTCEDCGHPLLRVERGRTFEVCLDADCDPLDDRVKAEFDRAWDCPDCGSDLRILRRGGLIAGCEAYPDCETGYSLPTGVVDGTCDCGLPAFETPTGRRCLDPDCGQAGGEPG